MLPGMPWLNYQHLLYFWAVARDGSVVAAAKRLHLAHPTISAQVHRLEEVLGQKLFEKKGRNLVLTEIGRVAFRYADEIFSLGNELLDTVAGRSGERRTSVVVGCSHALTKSIVYRMLAPAWRSEEPVRIICREDSPTEAFLMQLASHGIDVVLSDAPAGPTTPVRVFSHLLGECGTAFLAAPVLAKACRKGFPRSLNGMPFLLPGASSALRRTLEQWFVSRNIRPKIVGELDDPSLAEVAAEAGLGVFAVPDVTADYVASRHKLQLAGSVESLRQRFYAISIERQIKNPAVAAICEGARRDIFVMPRGKSRPR